MQDFLNKVLFLWSLCQVCIPESPQLVFDEDSIYSLCLARVLLQNKETSRNTLRWRLFLYRLAVLAVLGVWWQQFLSPFGSLSQTGSCHICGVSEGCWWCWSAACLRSGEKAVKPHGPIRAAKWEAVRPTSAAWERLTSPGKGETDHDERT